MKTLLCETVTAPSMAELRRRRDEVRHADLVELRLDSVADPDAAGALAGRTRPVIVTCRPTWEGGQFAGPEDVRRRLLSEAHALGAEYVDIEWKARFDDLLTETAGRRVVLSAHDFEGIPIDLADRLRAMRATGADVIKVAVTAHRLCDLVTLAEIGRRIGRDEAAVLIAMGPRGVVSRILPQRFQSRWTYAGAIGAVGQLDVSTLIDQYHFRSLGDGTALYGLAGSPLAHSVSPAMHNAAFVAAGIDAVYLPFDAEDVDDFMTFASVFGVEGASVTIPLKVSIVERVKEASEVARRVGAINTVRRVDGRWVGTNTDLSGFLRPIEERGIALGGMRASVLGSGGSARAVAFALAQAGATVTVHGRNRSGVERVAALVAGGVGHWPPAAGTWDVLVNCTPVGMHPNVEESPVPAQSLTGAVVYDLVYNPERTRLLREADSAGCVTVGGLDMLVAQAEEQFCFWTGVRPAPGVMRSAASTRLAEFVANEYHVA